MMKVSEFWAKRAIVTQGSVWHQGAVAKTTKRRTPEVTAGLYG